MPDLIPIRLQTSEAVSPLYGAWKQLWHRQDADPFLHPAWHAAFVASRGAKLRPVIVGAWRDAELVGVLPLRRDRDGVLRFLSASQSDYEDALLDERHGEVVLEALVEYLLGKKFDLAEVPEESPLGHALASRGLVPRPGAPCPGVELTPDTFLDVTRRKSLRRHQNKLARRGFTRLVAVDGANRLQALQRLFDQHIARRTAVGDDSLFLNPLNRAFYRELTGHADFPEFGDFQVLKAGDDDAAFHVGLRNQRTFIWYKPTFNLNLETEGPGEVLLKLLFEHAHGIGTSYFDFSRGEEAFKLRFANTSRANRRFMHRLPMAGRLVSRLKRRGLEVRNRIGAAVRRLAGHWHSAGADSIETVLAPGDPPRALDGYEAGYGAVDLVEFGALRLHCPAYVTRERMQSARERRARGDKLLIVRRRSDGVPVHFSWVRSEDGEHPRSPGAGATPGSPRIQTVFDSWTAPGRASHEIRRWAAEWVAYHSGRDDARGSVHE